MTCKRQLQPSLCEGLKHAVTEIAALRQDVERVYDKIVLLENSLCWISLALTKDDPDAA